MLRTIIVSATALLLALALTVPATAGDRGDDEGRQTKITLNARQVEAVKAAAGKPVTIDLTEGQIDALKRLDARCKVGKVKISTEHLGSANDVLMQINEDATKVNPIPSPKEM